MPSPESRLSPQQREEYFKARKLGKRACEAYLIAKLFRVYQGERGTVSFHGADVKFEISKWSMVLADRELLEPDLSGIEAVGYFSRHAIPRDRLLQESFEGVYPPTTLGPENNRCKLISLDSLIEIPTDMAPPFEINE